VPVLDRLMNLVGELVLARNQLLCHEANREDPRLTATSQRIHHLTAGLQESVMKARMQPIDNVFSRLPRVARDTAQACGKQVRLVTTGQETELDKTLLEAIKDPLTHVVRNSVDHGVESAEVRAAAGKPAEGTVAVRAFQDGGQVVIEVEDDGAGVALEKVRQKAVKLGLVTSEEAARLSEREVVDLIFRPGFSTAEAVTSISGRGVGMDVVRTNVERIGGSVEMVSRPGRGSVIRIRVPLTLVIVPALIVASGPERYAVPQSSLSELVRIGPERLSQMVVDLQGTTVLRLRGAILPLVDLARVLRSGTAAGAADGALSAVVLTIQGRTFGLLVDDVADTEEIVVKPLARQLQQLGVFSGATVRGDGRVALVLDVLGLARRAGVLADGETRTGLGQAAAQAAAARRPYLVLRGKDDGRIAIPLGEVARLEEIAPERVERVGGVEAVQYRGAILPLVRLGAALAERRRRPRVAEGPVAERLQVVVQEWEGREVGLVVDSVLDVVEEEAALDRTRARPGVAGCAVIQGRITEVLDTAHVLASQLTPAAQEVALGR
jgi:two-component system chemotaxis sensor kinase CheA